MEPTLSRRVISERTNLNPNASQGKKMKSLGDSQYYCNLCSKWITKGKGNCNQRIHEQSKRHRIASKACVATSLNEHFPKGEDNVKDTCVKEEVKVEVKEEGYTKFLPGDLINNLGDCVGPALEVMHLVDKYLCLEEILVQKLVQHSVFKCHVVQCHKSELDWSQMIDHVLTMKHIRSSHVKDASVMNEKLIILMILEWTKKGFLRFLKSFKIKKAIRGIVAYRDNRFGTSKFSLGNPDSKVFISVDDCGGLKIEVILGISKYFFLEGISVLEVGNKKPFLCEECLFVREWKGMLMHVMRRAHMDMNGSWKNKQTLSLVKEKLQILSSVQQNHDRLRFLPWASICRAVSLHSKLLQKMICMQPRSTNLDMITKEENKKAAVIGGSAFGNLQEEFHEMCVGRNIDDFEMECETCGVVIESYNNDIDLSVDMHIQTNINHALATAVSLERDPKMISLLSTAPESVVVPNQNCDEASTSVSNF